MMRWPILFLLPPSLLLLLLLFTTPVGAAPTLTCTWPQAAGFYETTVTDGVRSAGIVLTAKDTLGTVRYQSANLTFCVGTDDGAGVIVRWYDDAGVLRDTSPVRTDDQEDTWAPNTSTTGPLYATVTFQTGGAIITSNRLMAIAPLPPFDTTRCTAGPNNTCFDFDALPSYAIGGEVYNQFFNSRLQTLYDAAPTTDLPKNTGYFPNLAYYKYRKTGLATLGLYADDTTYVPTQFIFLYWWLVAGSEGFPTWTMTFTNDVRGVTGGAINLKTLVETDQGRTFTPGTSYYGTILLVTNDAAIDFEASNGFFAQVSPALAAIGDPASFIGVWKPENSGTYSGGTTNIPEDLNGGYLHVVEEAGSTMLRLIQTTSGTSLFVRGDGALSGYLSFYRGTNSREVDYTAQLSDSIGQQLQSIWVANTDGVTLPWVPFSFILTIPVDKGKILVREESDPKYPALVVDITHKELRRDLIPPDANSGLARLLAAPSIQNSSVRQAILGIGTAWGIGTGVGAVAAALTATGILFIATMVFVGLLPIALFVSLLALVFFILIGVLHPIWLILIMFVMLLGISWKLFGATA